MASAQKEYSILFKLGAKLGETFSGSFGSAQKILAATQKEIQALNKTQSNISAYQKQQESLEKTTSRLELYKEQLKNVQKEKAESGKSSSELANRELALKVRISETENAIRDKNKRLTEMSDTLTSAGVDVNALTDESKRLAEEMEALKRTEEQAAEEAENYGQVGGSSFEAVGSALMASGIMSGLQSIADRYKECVERSMEFGYTMSTVQALSGANSSEMKGLTEAAKEYGATTAFTANQSAEAMTYMGMAGWKAGQMISGMDGMLSLAAASGEDLGSVSDIVTDNLTAFKLEAKDTAHFADVLAAAATNSNTSVGIMGETFSGSAAIAGALGYSIEDVAIAVGEMANAGVKGSIAGTALKNIFNGLLSGATLTSQALGEIEFTAVNADGTMKGFSETIDELRGYFDQMTESERVNNAMTIAGQRGYNGLLAILNTTDEDYQKLSNSINNCTGAAQRMAEIKLDNLQGDVTLLDSAADGLKMTLGGLWNDELRGLAQIGTEILGGINDFCEKNPGVVKAIMAVGAEVGVVVAGYTAFTSVKKAKNTLDALSTALTIKNTAATGANTAATAAQAGATTGAATAQKGLNTAMLASPVFIITTAVVALTAAITILQEACKLEALETQTLSNATDKQKDSVSELTSEYERACNIYGETSDQARALRYDLEEATAAVDSQSFSVSELYAQIDSLHDSTAEMLGKFNDVDEEYSQQRERASVLVAKLKDLGETSEDTAKSQTQIQSIVDELNASFPSLGLNVGNVTDDLDGMMAKIDQMSGAQNKQKRFETAKEEYNNLLMQEKELLEASNNAEYTLWQAEKRYNSVTGNGNVFNIVGAMISGQMGTVDDDLHRSSEEAQKARDDLQAVQDKIAQCEDIFQEYDYTVSGSSDSIVSAYDAISIATSNVTEETTNLLQAYNDAYQAAYESVNGQYALWDQAEQILAVSAKSINSALESQSDYWAAYNENLKGLMERSENIDGLRDLIAGFADGSKESVNAITGLADSSDEELKRVVENWENVQKEQEEISKSLAETRVDFDKELDGIVGDVSKAVEKMNMEDEAKEAARKTISAYAQTLMSYKEVLGDAAQFSSKAVTDAVLNATSYEEVIRAKSGRTPYGSQAQVYVPFEIQNAYAGGTDSADKGWSLVGEEGPELAYFGGGEKVITARETKAILGSASDSDAGGRTVESITIAPQFIIQGNGDTEEQVQEISEKIVELIKDTLRSTGIDARRGAYT